MKKPLLLFFMKESGKYLLVSSDVLYKLEDKSLELLDKGHEIIKPVFVRGGKYCIIFSHETNPKSIHLEMKRLLEEKEELFNVLEESKNDIKK